MLPKYVYTDRGRYVYRPPKLPYVHLGRVDSLSIADVWRQYEKLTDKDTATVQFIADEYYKGKEGAGSFASLKDDKARAARRDSLDRLLATKAKGRWGDKRYETITPGRITKYLEYKGTVSANREIAALSAAWSYCYARDIVTLENPCIGVRRNPEHHRTRLVTPEEYKAIYDHAPKYIQVAMDLAYLCRMRRAEALDTRVRDMLDDGLDTRRVKGSKDAVTLWSDKLRKACDYGLEGCLRVPDMTIVNNNGRPVKAAAFSTAWQRLQVAAKSEGWISERFTFHDLKSMGVSNFKGDKLEAGGWSDPNMVKVYDRKKLEVEATE